MGAKESDQHRIDPVFVLDVQQMRVTVIGKDKGRLDKFAVVDDPFPRLSR
jgi:hypothetical protein